MDDEHEHEHEWGEPQRSRLAGTPHRACTVPFCWVITLDLTDDDYDDNGEDR
jgi:hypothetical protein